MNKLLLDELILGLKNPEDLDSQDILETLNMAIAEIHRLNDRIEKAKKVTFELERLSKKFSEDIIGKPPISRGSLIDNFN